VLGLLSGSGRSAVLRSPKGGAQAGTRKQGGAGRLSPRVVGGRHPLSLGEAGGLSSFADSGLSRRPHLWVARLGRRRDLPPPQGAAPILDGEASVPLFTDPHFASRWRVVAALRRELEETVVVTHHPVIADRAFALQTEDPVQFGRARCPAVIILRSGRRTCPAPALTPSAESPPGGPGSTAVPRSGASTPPRLLPDTASTTASPADSSRASASPHPPPAALGSAPAPAPRLFPTPSCSSRFAPI